MIIRVDPAFTNQLFQGAITPPEAPEVKVQIDFPHIKSLTHLL